MSCHRSEAHWLILQARLRLHSPCRIFYSTKLLQTHSRSLLFYTHSNISDRLKYCSHVAPPLKRRCLQGSIASTMVPPKGGKSRAKRIDRITQLDTFIATSYTNVFIDSRSFRIGTQRLIPAVEKANRVMANFNDYLSFQGSSYYRVIL